MIRRPIRALHAGFLALLLAACGSGDDEPPVAPALSTRSDNEPPW